MVIVKPGGTGSGTQRHVGQVGALAAEQVLHAGVAFGLAVAEEVDALYVLAAGAFLGAEALALLPLKGNRRRWYLPRVAVATPLFFAMMLLNLCEYVPILEGGKYRNHGLGVKLRESRRGIVIHCKLASPGTAKPTRCDSLCRMHHRCVVADAPVATTVLSSSTPATQARPASSAPGGSIGCTGRRRGQESSRVLSALCDNRCARCCRR